MSSWVGICIFHRLSRYHVGGGHSCVHNIHRAEDCFHSCLNIRGKKELFPQMQHVFYLKLAPFTWFSNQGPPPSATFTLSPPPLTACFCYSLTLWIVFRLGLMGSLHPTTPTITLQPHSPQWLWVGTSLGNWSLWALQMDPAEGWTGSPLRRQLLRRPVQADRKGEG